MCGSFTGGTALSGIHFSVAAGAPAQTVLLDQTGPGGVFPCSAPLEGILRANDVIQVMGASGEALSAGDTAGGSGINLNSCSSVGTIAAVGSYELIAGSGGVTLSAGGGAGFTGALDVPATLRPSSASSDTLIAGATPDAIDFSAVTTSGSVGLTINVSGRTSRGVLNDTASVGSVTDTFSSGPGEFTTFDASADGNTRFVGGASGDTFGAPAGPGAATDTLDFSGASGSQLVINVSGATSGSVANDSAELGTVVESFSSNITTFDGLAGGNSTLVAGPSSETFDATGSNNAINLSSVPTTPTAPLVVNLSGSQSGSVANNSAATGIITDTFSSSVTSFTAADTGSTTFLPGANSETSSASGSSATDTIDFSAAATSGSTPLVINLSGGPAGSLADDTAKDGSVIDSFTSGAADFTTFVGASSGDTDFVAGPSSATFANPGGASGDAIDFSAVPTSSTTPLTVNLSGAAVDGVASETAAGGNVSDHLSTGGAALTLLAAQSGYTTFLPGSTSETFQGNGAATDTLDFAGVPTSSNAPLVVNRSGSPYQATSNNTATAGAATYTFSGSAFTTFNASADGNTRFLASATADTFGAPAGPGTDTLDFSQTSGMPLTINLSGATSNGVANDSAQLGTVTETFSPNIATFDGLAGGNTTFLAGASGGQAFRGLGTGNLLGLQAVPANATVTANSDSDVDPGQVQPLAAGVAGSTTDSFADIQSYVSVPNALTTIVDDPATGAPWSGTEEPGASADNTAAVSAISNVAPTGTVTYELFANGTCAGTAITTQQVTLSTGSVPDSSPTAPLARGAYSFQANYSGDASYRPSTSLCDRFGIPDPPSAPSTTTTSPTSTTPTTTTSPTNTTPTTTTSPTNTTPSTTSPTVAPVVTPVDPMPTGYLSGRTLGRVRLGMTRTQSRREYAPSASHHEHYEDVFALAGGAVRIGYPSPRLLATLSPRQRHALDGRVVLALTANPYYALRGIRSGARLRTAAKSLHPGAAIRVGRTDWYMVRDGASTAVLQVRRNTVQEVGIADATLTHTRRAQRTFIRSFS